jgi:predicted GTPase
VDTGQGCVAAQSDQFDCSVAGAVAAGLDEIEGLEKVAKAVTTGDLPIGGQVPGSVSGAEGAMHAFDARRHEFAQKLQTHLARQRGVLSTFNIAFFGRTGAGKSTLLSAFGELDGSAVSPGESDWTVETHSVSWRGCKLFDTPGINGWGRSKTRAELEANARQAVEIADVVLLCFDSQSQQASEFIKVAEWVRHFGKPTIAVLNNRNLRWRHPAKVVDQTARRNISEPVRQHVSNIRGELANIGLHDTPVVALNSRRALFARASSPYGGPAATDFHREREDFGIDYLARWSNFGTLEVLIAAGVTTGGKELRLTALREGMRALLDDEATGLDQLEAEYDQRIAELDRAVAQHLEVLGYLEADERNKYLKDEGQEDLLSRAEEVRGAPYRSPIDGSLSRHVKNLVKPQLAEPRSNAMRRFRKIEQEAFDKGEKVDEKRFAEAVFDEGEVSAALEAVCVQASGFLERELSIATAELRQRSASGEGDGATFDGAAGKTAENMEILLRGGGLLGGIGAIAFLVSNPVGWVTGAVLAGIGVTTMVMGWLGTSAGESAEKQRAKARRDAYRAGATAVFETFDRIEKQFIEEARAGAWQAAESTVRSILRELLTLSSLRANAIELARIITAASAGIPESPSANIFSDAEIAGSLLGEDWFDHSHVAGDRTPEQARDLAARCAERNGRDSAVLMQVLADAAVNPGAADIAQWRKRIEHAASDDNAFADVLTALAELPSKPSLAVVGDFSAGKSSFIKRLLVELTGSSPKSLAIRADPTTSTVARYELPRFDLIDTPGFQSGRHQHDVRALAGADQSTLVIALFQVNLLIGDTAELQGLISGTETTVGHWPRVLVLINRCDEIGVDPDHAVGEYFNRVDRKKIELQSALRSREIEVDDTNIHAVASDPFGVVGAQWPVARDDYEPHRSWDGVSALVDALQSVADDALAHAQRVADFDRSRSCLLAARLEAQRQVDGLQLDADKRQSVIQALELCLKDADYLSESLEHTLQEKMRRHAARAIERVRVVPRGEPKKLEQAISSWAGEEAELEVGRFMESACEQINEWTTKYQSEIGREFQSAGIADATNLFGIEIDATAGDDAIDGATRTAGRAAQAAQKVAGGFANRDAAYAVGKAFKVKFKPWGAVKAGKNVTRVGVVFQVVAVGLDAANWINAEMKRKSWQGALARAEAKVGEETEAKAVELLRGEDGPLEFLDERRHAVYEALEDSRRLSALMQEEIEKLRRRVGVAEDLLAEAETLRKVGK